MQVLRFHEMRGGVIVARSPGAIELALHRLRALARDIARHAAEEDRDLARHRSIGRGL